MSDVAVASPRSSCSGAAYGASSVDLADASVRSRTVRADGDPEVRQVRVALVVDEDVGRLDVAVDDTRAVRRLQRAAELIDHRGGLRGAQGAVFEDGRQAPASHQPHHEVRRIGLAPVVVERNDVRVLEPGDQLRLGLEATDEVGVVGHAPVE